MVARSVGWMAWCWMIGATVLGLLACRGAGERMSDGGTPAEAAIDVRADPATMVRFGKVEVPLGALLPPERPPLTACGQEDVKKRSSRLRCWWKWNDLVASIRAQCKREGGVRVELFWGCHGYNIMVVPGADAVEMNYYSSVTGKLVTMYDSGMMGEQCFGELPPVSPEDVLKCEYKDCRDFD